MAENFNAQRRTGDAPPIPGDPNEPSVDTLDPEPAVALADSPELLGIPDHRPDDARPVTETENLFPTTPEEQADEPWPDAPPLPSWRRGWLLSTSGIGALLTLFIGGSLLFLIAQAVSLMSEIEKLPDWVRLPALFAAGLLALAMLIAALRLAGLYLRLRASPVISVRAMQELSARAELREVAARQLAAACAELRGFIARYPLEGQYRGHLLSRAGFTPEQIERLRTAAARLQGREATTYEGWLNECNQTFLAVLDEAARRRIRQYAIAVGIKTAAVPTGFADTAIVLLNAYLMIGDLCRIYNLRANRLGTLAILGHVFVNAFSAANLEHLTDVAANSVGDAVSTAGGLLAGMAKTATARLAEGSANGLLFRRLGLATMRRLRPIQLPN